MQASNEIAAATKIQRLFRSWRCVSRHFTLDDSKGGLESYPMYSWPSCYRGRVLARASSSHDSGGLIWQGKEADEGEGQAGGRGEEEGRGGGGQEGAGGGAEACRWMARKRLCGSTLRLGARVCLSGSDKKRRCAWRRGQPRRWGPGQQPPHSRCSLSWRERVGGGAEPSLNQPWRSVGPCLVH